MEKERKICAIIDTQGFFVDQVFYPREIAIFNKDIRICVEVYQDRKSFNLDKHRNTLNYQQHRIHGFPIDSILKPQTKKVIKGSKIKEFIEEIYFRVKSEEKYLFGVKNQQLKKLLIEYQIPYFDLETESVGGEFCPALKVFDKFHHSIFCLVHASIKPVCGDHKLHCALRKAWNIWKWYSIKLNSDTIMKELQQVLQE